MMLPLGQEWSQEEMGVFCNGPLDVNPSLSEDPSPGSCFCPQSARGRCLMGSERTGRSI